MGRATGEIRTVQALRAFACLLVVIYHAIDSWGAGLIPPRRAEAVWPNAAAGVDLFFVISGFVMAGAAGRLHGVAGGWRRFLARRLRRIVPLYWGLTVARLAIGLALTGVRPASFYVLASLLFLPARDAAGIVRPLLGVGWTLQFEMLFYGVVAVALASGARLLPWAWAMLAPLAVAGFYRTPSWPAPLMLGNGLVLEFCLGLAVARLVARPARLRPAADAGLLLAASALLLWLPPPGPWRFLAWGVPSAGLLLAAVRLEPVLGGRIPRGILSIGDASYAIYLLHPFVVPPLATSLAWALAQEARGGAIPLGMLLALSLAASVAGGKLLHRWVDAPIQAWLGGRESARPLRDPPGGHVVEP